MKRRLFLMVLVAIMGFSFIGCSSSDSDDPTSGVTIDKKILGTWRQVEYYNADLQKWTGLTQYGFFYTFNSDGTYKTDAHAKGSGTFTFNGSVLTLDGGFGETIKFSENNTMIEWGKWRYQKK